MGRYNLRSGKNVETSSEEGVVEEPPAQENGEPIDPIIERDDGGDDVIPDPPVRENRDEAPAQQEAPRRRLFPLLPAGLPGDPYLSVDDNYRLLMPPFLPLKPPGEPWKQEDFRFPKDFVSKYPLDVLGQNPHLVLMERMAAADAQRRMRVENDGKPMEQGPADPIPVIQHDDRTDDVIPIGPIVDRPVEIPAQDERPRPRFSPPPHAAQPMMPAENDGDPMEQGPADPIPVNQAANDDVIPDPPVRDNRGLIDPIPVIQAADGGDDVIADPPVRENRGPIDPIPIIVIDDDDDVNEAPNVNNRPERARENPRFLLQMRRDAAGRVRWVPAAPVPVPVVQPIVQPVVQPEDDEQLSNTDTYSSDSDSDDSVIEVFDDSPPRRRS